MARRRILPRKERRANIRDLSVPLEELELDVFRDDDGVRLDSFLAGRFAWQSKTGLQQRIDDGLVRIRGRTGRVKKSTKLKAGDVVLVDLPPPKEVIRHEELAEQLHFLFEDKDFIAVNKPPDLVVHPVGQIRNNTLIQALHWHYRRGRGHREGQKLVIPKICHRLDRETSGVMIVAKNDRSRREIQETFERREVRKRYLTVLVGRVDWDEQRVDGALGPDPDSENNIVMAIRPDGLPALSVFRCLERSAGHSLCEVAIHTGRQHQIRVHALSLGHPVLGDSLYDTASERIGRQALHARQIAFAHPTTQRECCFKAPLPADFLALLVDLGLSDPYPLPPSEE